MFRPPDEATNRPFVATLSCWQYLKKSAQTMAENHHTRWPYRLTVDTQYSRVPRNPTFNDNILLFPHHMKYSSTVSIPLSLGKCTIRALLRHWCCWYPRRTAGSNSTMRARQPSNSRKYHAACLSQWFPCDSAVGVLSG